MRRFVPALFLASGAALLAGALTATTESLASAESQPAGQAAQANKLLKAEDLKYLGAFRLPDTGNKLASTFPYGGKTAAFNPEGNKGAGSLFIGGHDHQQLVAEVSIPQAIKSKDLNKLKTATLVQPFGDVTGGLRNSMKDKQLKLGGLLVHKGKLLWTVYLWYNVSNVSLPSHGLSELNLAQPKAHGLWYIGNYDVQKTGGFLCTVPQPWEKKFGYPLLTGNQKSQGRATSSEGPAAFGFNPWEKSAFPPSGSKLSGQQFLWYDLKHPLVSTWSGASHNWKGANSVAGMAFPLSKSGEKSAVVFFGKIGLHPGDWYGEAKDFPGPGKPDSDSKGYHAPPYKSVAWFYNPADLLKVAKGLAAPYSIKPYLQVDLSDNFFTADQRIAAVAYDPTSRKVYITEAAADQKNQYDSWPLVHVYQVH